MIAQEVLKYLFDGKQAMDSDSQGGLGGETVLLMLIPVGSSQPP